jgi:hypothetical protein
MESSKNNITSIKNKKLFPKTIGNRLNWNIKYFPIWRERFMEYYSKPQLHLLCDITCNSLHVGASAKCYKGETL